MAAVRDVGKGMDQIIATFGVVGRAVPAIVRQVVDVQHGVDMAVRIMPCLMNFDHAGRR